MNTKSFILTIDIGTSSTRAILFNHNAQLVPGCVAQVSNQMRTTRDGGGEFDAEQLLANVVSVIDKLLQTAGPLAEQIGGVAMASLVSNVMGLNRAGDPITPIFTYADTRNAEDATALRTELGNNGSADAHNRTGCLIHTSYLPARFRWLARVHPAWMNEVSHWGSIGEYLFEKFLGQRIVSHSVASWTGMLNRHDLTWDWGWLEFLNLDVARLSPLMDISQPAVGLQKEWAQRWPALKDVPWYPAIGDGAAANIGSGCDGATHGQQRIALTIGTTGAMRVVIDEQSSSEQHQPLTTMPDGLWLYRVDKRRSLLGGATTEGGNFYSWARRTLQLPSAELEEALSNRPPAIHGLTVLPFVAGERAPGWNDDARASLIGFTLNTQPLDILQAGLEAIAYRFALIYGRIAPNLIDSNNAQIIASGGALLSSPVWLQMMADVLAHPVCALGEKEITSRGLALLALEQLGIIENTSDLPPIMGKTYEPNLERHAIHQEGIARQVELYERLQ